MSAADTPAASAGGIDAPALDPHESSALLDLAVEAAKMAGALLAERVHRGAEHQISAKSTPTDLVSEADLASEQAIRALLSGRRPHDGFIGEESDDEEGSSGLSWVVDPLDGTVNFLFGIPQWCVSVAVTDSQGAVAGAVYDPNRGELFSACRDGPAMITGPSGERELSGSDRPPELSTAMLATGYAYDAQVRAAQAKVLARVVPCVRDVRRFGSAALDLAWTAAGRYDAYFERTVKSWDIAAGQLICERAGLSVLELPVHEHLPWGILAARRALAEPLLELVGGP